MEEPRRGTQGTRIILVVSSILLLFWSAYQLRKYMVGDTKGKAEDAINRLLKNQQTAWNDGNLDKFLAGYLPADEVTLQFGTTEVKGQKDLAELYTKQFQKHGKDHGTLVIEVVEMRMITDEAAVVRGRWQVTYKQSREEGGLFAMLIQKFPGGWRIVQELRTEEHDFNREKEDEAIRKVLVDQQKAWNEGNLEKFMEGYWNSEDLTFSSENKTQRGWQATFDRYRKRYQSEGKEMGNLEFRDLDVDLVNWENALVKGHWELTFKDGKTMDGLFTLRFRRFPEGWRIVHDHTSVKAGV
jgi:beta-aspartyl-peptidase (threonine type)